jgi:hypothetical protein
VAEEEQLLLFPTRSVLVADQDQGLAGCGKTRNTSENTGRNKRFQGDFADRSEFFRTLLGVERVPVGGVRQPAVA